MAQQHLDPTAGPVAGDALAAYLRAQATEFLRALRQHRETGGAAGGGPPARAQSSVGDNGSKEAVDAARSLRRSARRISGTLHTFRPLLDEGWSETMRPELAWLSGTLAREHAYGARQERLLAALHRLSGSAAFPAQATSDVRREKSQLTVGAAKAGALLERQLTLARTRAHSAALQALGSSRFHAVADNVAVLASEVPLTAAATTAVTTATADAASAGLKPLAAAAEDRLRDAVTGLPLVTAGHPYNSEALVHGLSADTAPQPQDAPWHQVRLLLRLHRYAREVLFGDEVLLDVRLLNAGKALDRHRDAAEAAAAAASAARTPRIAPATAYALGVLHADQRHEVEAARFTFQRAWMRETVGTP
ncbi:metal-binding protein [Streptomyces dioscori]|uniref:Metal-binding protein n=1 Tax=Streptomyces dioscori TaxID=2109333 RepID=A0A2P8QDQ8_9ACTN|nr:CHAD domain-containing protein [Streptomyces dioscori]PSM44348.1 metal-binding protein [Streptomyces dioscori]